MISADIVKQLREKTGASMMDCKKALEEASGDEAKAMEILKGNNKLTAMKKAERVANQGLIEAYIHANGKIGVLLEIKCETDFVAKNEEFKELAHEIAMHIAGMDSKDPDSLLSEPFIKNPSITVKDLIEAKIGKLGENMRVEKFIRYEL